MIKLTSKLLKERIEHQFDELEFLLKNGKLEEAGAVIPHLSKFLSVLTEEQREFLNAAKVAVEDELEWK